MQYNFESLNEKKSASKKFLALGAAGLAICGLTYHQMAPTDTAQSLGSRVFPYNDFGINGDFEELWMSLYSFDNRNARLTLVDEKLTLVAGDLSPPDQATFMIDKQYCEEDGYLALKSMASGKYLSDLDFRLGTYDDTTNLDSYCFKTVRDASKFDQVMYQSKSNPDRFICHDAEGRVVLATPAI